jgi:hypothetical protein
VDAADERQQVQRPDRRQLGRNGALDVQNRLLP